MSSNILNSTNLAHHTSWLIGGPAEHFCLPQNQNELLSALSWARQHNQPVTVLGGGSNVLISDRGIKGLVVCLQKFSTLSFEIKDERIWITSLAGTPKSELLKLFLKHQLAPSLFLAGLPGDVGGGVVMNAGVAESFEPREFMELVDSIEVTSLAGEILTLQKNQLHVQYRHTDGWQPHIVTKVFLSWPYKQNPEVLSQVRDANKSRLAKQPLDKPSCGSVFKNPDGYKVAQLIDQCGLKGFQMGNAQVSLKHANFIVNLGEATATDTWNLILHVQKTVKERTGISINTEVIRLGEW